MCPLLNRDYYVYIIIVRSEKGVHAPQLPIRTSNAKPDRAVQNCTSQVYPARQDILNTLVYTSVRTSKCRTTGPLEPVSGIRVSSSYPESRIRNRAGNQAVQECSYKSGGCVLSKGFRSLYPDTYKPAPQANLVASV